MADLPEATVTIDDEAGAFAGLSNFVIVAAPVKTNPDLTPRVFSSVKALLAQHDYSQGASYVGIHIQKTRKPVIFIGMPIATPGIVRRQDTSAVIGTSLISVAAGSSGSLDEVKGKVRVKNGGTVGTPGVVVEVSGDGGLSWKTVRLGTATTYQFDRIGLTVTFGAGTLVAGDLFEFTTSAPMWDQAGLTAAREALATQQKLARKLIVIGDVPDATTAGFVVTEINAYETENERDMQALVSIKDGGVVLPKASKIKKQMKGQPQLTFAEVGGTGDTVTRDTGSWLTDGFAIGDVVTFAGTLNNNVTGPIANLSATVLTFGTTDLVAEVTTTGVTVVGSPGLTFAEVGATGDTMTRTSGSWIDEGLAVGDTVAITGTSLNNVSGSIAALSATVLTFGTTDLAAEVIGMHNVTITKVQTKAAWMSAADTAFATISSQRRIQLNAGRLTKACTITGWLYRRPVQWADCVRAYEHDVHIATYEKDNGPLDGWGFNDENGLPVEFDERSDGGGLAARFTVARSWANGPEGAYIALSLTRAPEASNLSRSQNMDVANLACAIARAETENFIGRSLVLKSDGKAKPASLALCKQKVDKALQVNLLQGGKEGQRCSGATWNPSVNDILNIPGATLNAELPLNFNGTIEKVNTSVRIQTAG